jgi:hypothetical protein
MSSAIESVSVAAPPERLRLEGRELELRLTSRAARALRALSEPLDIELELYFSCFLRKRVNFRAQPREDVQSRARLTELATVSFRPVMTRACPVRDATPDVEHLPLVRARAFTPRWLALDFARGRWCGRFGF